MSPYGAGRKAMQVDETSCGGNLFEAKELDSPFETPHDYDGAFLRRCPLPPATYHSKDRSISDSNIPY